MYLNKVIIAGRITRKPELRATKDSTKVTNFAVAVTEQYKAENGEKKEVTDFIDVTVFGKLSEVCAEYLDKGQEVIVEGKIKVRKYEVAGDIRYSTFVQAQNVQFGAKAQGKGKVERDTDNTESNAPESKNTTKVTTFDTIEYPTEDINPEDIPF